MDLALSPELKTNLQFFHPMLMWATFALAFYALYLGVQVRRLRTGAVKDEAKKKLIQGKVKQKHFQMGSLFMVLIVLGTFGGMAVTYLNNGKLFVGPHLLAGLGMTSLLVISSSLSPLMLEGKNWARNIHVLSNIVMLGIFGWQAATGVEIVQKILASLS